MLLSRAELGATVPLQTHLEVHGAHISRVAISLGTGQVTFNLFGYIESYYT